MLSHTEERKVRVLGNYTMEVLEERIGYKFQNRKLLQQALTHSSFSNEQKIRKTQDYERLEFLGDAVLELVSSEFLFHTHKNVSEGDLTRLRASMVCETSLAFCARELEIGLFMRLGKGEEGTGGRQRESIIADAMEAVTGAIYLDGGFEQAKAFVNRFILSDLEDKQLFIDSKSNLQELAQGQLKGTVQYELISENGPEHNKAFQVVVKLGDQVLGSGTGKSKKAAEQQAAYEALLRLRKKGYVFKKY